MQNLINTFSGALKALFFKFHQPWHALLFPSSRSLFTIIRDQIALPQNLANLHSRYITA